MSCVMAKTIILLFLFTDLWVGDLKKWGIIPIGGGKNNYIKDLEKEDIKYLQFR